MDFEPHVVPPPEAAPAPMDSAPRRQTTEHRSRASVALHWALMLGGFALVGLLGQLLG
ncbi:hypothetical protein [Paracoccus ravus]|uniref:hypothetical protein n=1 Tax=Paracoccus ravus TaxID=2447760 RepID=UPI00143017E5|nr:hypothetical protein [Paracoccus ravus]